MPDKKPPKKSAPKLTKREGQYLQARIGGANKKTSAEQAGYSPLNPRQSAAQAENNIKRKMPEVLESLGLSPENFINKHLLPALGATKVSVAFRATAKGGTFHYSKPMRDNAAVNRAMELLAEIAGWKIKEAENTSGPQLRVMLIDSRNRPPMRSANPKLPQESENA